MGCCFSRIRRRRNIRNFYSKKFCYQNYGYDVPFYPGQHQSCPTQCNPGVNVCSNSFCGSTLNDEYLLPLHPNYDVGGFGGDGCSRSFQRRPAYRHQMNKNTNYFYYPEQNMQQNCSHINGLDFANEGSYPLANGYNLNDVTACDYANPGHNY